jgi:hypothetical protein
LPVSTLRWGVEANGLQHFCHSTGLHFWLISNFVTPDVPTCLPAKILPLNRTAYTFGPVLD